jgi:DNA-binding CsgD family transcriptional regulator
LKAEREFALRRRSADQGPVRMATGSAQDGELAGWTEFWFESEPTPVLLVAWDGRVLDANPAGEALLEAGEAMRLSGSRLTFEHAAARKSFERALERLAGDGLDEVSAILRCDDGVWRRIDLMRCRRPPVDAAFVVVQGTRPGQADMSTLASAFRLTPAECRVLSLLAEGVSTKKIAAELGISPNTVRAHLRGLYGKVNVSGLADLMREYARLTL